MSSYIYLPMAACSEDRSTGLEAIRERSELASRLLMQAQKLRLGRNVSQINGLTSVQTTALPGDVFAGRRCPAGREKDQG